MKRAYGSNVSGFKDGTGGMVSLDWTCPHCDFENADLFFSSLVDQLSSHFEVDRECNYCGKKVTVECEDVSYDGLKVS